MIAFLHTTKVLKERFENLVRKFDKDIPIQHVVNEDLLSYALREGEVDMDSFKKDVAALQRLKPTLLICTCSTYGEAADSLKGVHRIDFPIAEYLVRNYSKIALVYAASSTKVVSENILKKQAELHRKEIDIQLVDCVAAWKYFEKGDTKVYAKAIANEIQKIEQDVDVVFLAQASMEGAIQLLDNFSKPIYSSPEFGIQSFLKKA